MSTRTQTLTAGTIILTKDLELAVRIAFVRKVYAILTVQLALTAAIAAPIALFTDQRWMVDHVWLLGVGLVVYICCSCAAICCRSVFRKYPWNYLILLGLTCGLSIMVGFISARYTWQSVLLAAGLTSVVFCGLTAYAWLTKRDWTGCGPFLFAFCLGLLSVALAIWILRLCGVVIVWLYIAYDILGILLFSFYIIFDTQLIMGEWGGHKMQFAVDDYCLAAVQLYLDIINLFLFILRLFGRRN